MSGDDVHIDHFLEEAKNAKNAPSVMKYDLAVFASGVVDEALIFVYEGRDDRIVYDSWISRIKPGIKYEPYDGKNKPLVLKLFDILQCDLTGLREQVYLFVDKDFDGLGGRAPDKRLFVGDKYSIENYIVCADVLDSLLKIEFHCCGRAELRKQVVHTFLNVYDAFLTITRSLNLRLYAANALRIRRVSDPIARIARLAKVDLQEVEGINFHLNEIIPLDREPTKEELEALAPDFDCLVPRDHFRGKFAISFFIYWLGLLRKDRTSANPILFGQLGAPGQAVDGDFKMHVLAHKAPPPANLANFLANIP